MTNNEKKTKPSGFLAVGITEWLWAGSGTVGSVSSDKRCVREPWALPCTK